MLQQDTQLGQKQTAAMPIADAVIGGQAGGEGGHSHQRPSSTQGLSDKRPKPTSATCGG